MAKTNARAVSLLKDHLEEAHEKPRRRDAFTPAPAKPETAKLALSYLDAFGYLAQELGEWKDITLDDILKAVGDFQKFFGLKRTRELDIPTLKAMQMPRCGCPDVPRERFGEHLAMKMRTRAALAKWNKLGLTYYIQHALPGFDKAAYQAAVQRAFDAWTIHGNGITARPAAPGSTPDIVLSTGRGSQSNFDGPSGTLAWAYLPNGRDTQLTCKFDLDETWLMNAPAGRRGIIFHNVACHEFGHLFGLDHSKVNTALMAPYYSPQVSLPQSNDDIPRFQSRYGKGSGVPTSPPASPPTTPTPSAPTVTLTTNGLVNLIVNGQKV